MSAYPNQFQSRYMHTWLYQHKGILWNKLHSTQDVTEFLFKYSSSSVLLSKRSKSLRTKSNSHMSLYFSLYKTKKQYGYTFFLTSKLLGFFFFHYWTYSSIPCSIISFCCLMTSNCSGSSGTAVWVPTLPTPDDTVESKELTLLRLPPLSRHFPSAISCSDGLYVPIYKHEETEVILFSKNSVS